MSSTYLDLNNKGVCHLRDGKYEEASKLFRKAFNVLKGTITRDNGEGAVGEAASALQVSESTSAADEGAATTIEAKRTEVSSASEGSSMSSDNDDRRGQTHPTPPRRPRKRKAAHHQEEGGKQDQSSNEGQSSKHRRIDAPRKRRGSHMLCRPLWLQPDQSRGAFALFASSILYNLAYALHRMGTEHCDDSSSTGPQAQDGGVYFRRQAMTVYTKVFQLCGKRRCPVVKWMCCHNLQQLVRMELAQVADPKMAKRLVQRFRNLETHKVLILRARFSAGGCSDQMFLSVLSFLGLGGLERPDVPAAAA